MDKNNKECSNPNCDCDVHHYCLCLDKSEVKSLIKELDNTYINPNENPLISGIINRMIKFVDDK